MDRRTSPPELDHHTHNLPSGVVIHTWPVPSPRAIIVLQHGFGEYAERYINLYHGLIPKLNKHGFEVHAMDMWGHGRSPGSAGTTHVGRAVFDHLKLRREASQLKLPIFLIGHSLGGLITAGSVVAEFSPQLSGVHLSGVILLSPALPGPTSKLARRAAGVLAYLLPKMSLPVRPQPLTGLSRLPEIAAQAEIDHLMLKQQIPLLLGATALETAQTVWESLEDWKCPTLVMHGVADNYTNCEASKRLVDGIASTDKTLTLFESGLHEILNDLDREEALQQILAWLDEHAC